ncbi:MAG: ADP-forming succinate--CoA ligase subunit beta [Solirubrobacterales bacterium]
MQAAGHSALPASRMDLLEYQGKQLFADAGVPVPLGYHAATLEQAREAAGRLEFPVVVKAQVQIGGRGKAGGVKVAKDMSELERHAEAMLGMDIKGLTVGELWIEKASEIAAEYYAAIIFDRSARKPLVMFSRMGGMDIEQVADQHPEALVKLHVDPLVGFQAYHGRRVAYESGIDADVVKPVAAMLARLYDVFIACDTMLVEVNPLIVTANREVMALDAKVSVDDNALSRQPTVAEMRNPSAEDPQEQMAKERGITYVKLDGDVGIFGNGAGLVMSTLDVVAQAGGRPANFLDAGGGAKAELIVSALEVLLSDPKVNSVLINIFGGITRCDEVATGLLTAIEQIEPAVPFVVRLDGTNDEQGRKIIAEANNPLIHPAKTMLEAADMVVTLARNSAPSELPILPPKEESGA